MLQLKSLVGPTRALPLGLGCSSIRWSSRPGRRPLVWAATQFAGRAEPTVVP
jgi:hypothetical protein